MRVIVAVIAGYFADRFSGSKIIMICFALNLVGGLAISLGFMSTRIWFVVITFSTILIGVYGVRVLYFAVLQEAKIPLFTTGTVVGIISFIGFTPDVFMSPLAGYLLDENPGELGHQYVFLVLAVFSLIGLITAIRFTERKQETQKHSIIKIVSSRQYHTGLVSESIIRFGLLLHFGIRCIFNEQVLICSFDGKFIFYEIAKI